MWSFLFRGTSLGLLIITILGACCSDGSSAQTARQSSAVGDAKQKLEGRVRRKEPKIIAGPGELNPTEVDAVVAQKIRLVIDCYESELSRVPTLRGKVAVRFVISESGKVASAKCVQNELSWTFGSCLEKAFTQYVFPPPRGGAMSAEYFMLLTPANSSSHARPE